ncbi:MAG TPA: DsrE family protein [Bryobacteraceae bacterium]|nr:DsrE family protein [Bryobacteraceae bacterium]
MTILFVLNDHPYESERTYNALRLATMLAVDQDNTVNLFLIGDAVHAAVSGLPVPEGRDDIPWMLARFSAGHRKVAVCRTCLDRRGISESALIESAYRSSLDELARWTCEADKVLVF